LTARTEQLASHFALQFVFFIILVDLFQLVLDAARVLADCAKIFLDVLSELFERPFEFLQGQTSSLGLVREDLDALLP